jgi:transposase
MPYFVGLDASKETTHICVMDRDGAVVETGVVETAAKTIAGFLRGQRRRYVRVGAEAWAISSWLHEGLAKAGLPIVLIDARHAHGLLKSQRNKTDKNDARGIADMMRVGVYRPVHVKSAASQETRMLLAARAMLTLKAHDVANFIHGVLLGAGLKLARLQRRTYEARVRALIAGSPFMKSLIEPLLAARAAILRERDGIEARLLTTARADPVCQRLMTAPGVGELTALIYRSSIDEPARFPRSRALGPHLGLTSRTYQSGDVEWRGRITKCGDGILRRALVTAAMTSLKKNTRESWLKAWARGVAERRGGMKAAIAVARRLAVVLHRMWVTQTDFRWEAPVQV